MKTINVPIAGILTPFEQNELFDYLMDYFVFSQRIFAVSQGLIKMTDADINFAEEMISRSIQKIVPLLEKCGMKGKKIEMGP